MIIASKYISRFSLKLLHKTKRHAPGLGNDFQTINASSSKMMPSLIDQPAQRGSLGDPKIKNQKIIIVHLLIKKYIHLLSSL